MRCRKPVWTEGLFITQHHFQQLDRYHEALLATRLGAVTPYDWGVTSLEIDERSLAAGQLRVLRLDAVLPEGTPMTIGDASDDVVQPRQVATALPATTATLDVYVGLATESDTTGNVGLEGAPSSYVRYT